MIDILVRPLELRQTAENFRSGAQKIGRAMEIIDNQINALNSNAFLGQRANAMQFHYQSKRDALYKAKEIILHFAAELDAAANAFERADNQQSQTCSGPQDFNEWANNVSWTIEQEAGQEPVLILADGKRINLADLRSGNPDALKAYGEFLGKSSDTFTVLEQITKAKWTQVSGYVSRNGNWVDDYWRSLPGGGALAKKLGALGLALTATEIGSSIFQAVTDKAENQWISIPLGIVDGKEVVYTYYFPKQDHWRDVATKAGGFVGGAVGLGVGAAVGVELGPGAVVPAIGGALAGNEVGESMTGVAYDKLIKNQDIPTRPASMLGGEVQKDTIQNFQNEEVNQIDVGQLIRGDKGSGKATLTFKVDKSGNPQLEYLIVPIVSNNAGSW